MSQQKEEETISIRTKLLYYNVFQIKFISNRNERRQRYLELSILELSKILMNEFCYEYAKSKFGEKTKLCDMDTNIIYIKTDEICGVIAEDVETRFDTSNYELDRPFSQGKNKKVILLMKDELGRKIMTKLLGLGTKTYSYLIGNSSEVKKNKKKCIIKRKLKFENYKNRLEPTQLENKINYIHKNKIGKNSIKENHQELNKKKQKKKQ